MATTVRSDIVAVTEGDDREEMVPTPDLAALMAGLLAAPRWNTGARMALADCMIETGNREWVDRGEFIRLQLAHEESRNKRVKRKLARQFGKLFYWNAVLLRKWKPFRYWLDTVNGAIRTHGGPAQIGWPAMAPGGRLRNATVRRGFMDHVEMTPEEWLQHGDALLTMHPIRSVALDRYPRWFVSSFDEALEATGGVGEQLSLRGDGNGEIGGKLVKDTCRSVAGIRSVPVGLALMMIRFPLIEQWSLRMRTNGKSLTIVNGDGGWKVDES